MTVCRAGAVKASGVGSLPVSCHLAHSCRAVIGRIALLLARAGAVSAKGMVLAGSASTPRLRGL